MELKEDKNILGVLVETFFTGEITDEYIDLVKDSTMYKAFKNIEENKKKQQIDPNDDFKEYTIELSKKLDCDIEKGMKKYE